MGECFFALFIFAGQYKADPRLQFIQERIDLTLLFMFLSMIAYIYQVLRRKHIDISTELKNSFLLFISLGLCFLSGAVLTGSTRYGMDKALRFISLTAWAFLGAGLQNATPSSLKRFLKSCIIIVIAISLDAVLNYPGVGKIGFVTALGGNYIGVARAAGFGILIILLFLWQNDRRFICVIVYIIMMTLLLWAMLSSGARGPIFAIIIGLLIYMVLNIELKQKKIIFNKYAIFIFILIIGVSIIFVKLGETYFPTLIKRSRMFIEAHGEYTGRPERFAVAIDLWLRSPLWGIGSGQFAMGLHGNDIRDYPHNILLELMVETGILGLSIFSIILYRAIRKAKKLIKDSNFQNKYIGRFLMTMLSFTFWNAMVSGDINDNRELFVIIGIILGILPGLNYGKEIGKKYDENSTHIHRSLFL